MRYRRLIVVSFVASLAMGLVVVPPASAEVGGGVFQCFGRFPSWPDWGATDCTGIARGVFREGTTTVVCAPFCNYTMTMNYSALCFLGEPALIGDFSGDIEISNGSTFETSYSATLVGTQVAITTSSPVGAGHATLVPSPPIPTCNAHGPMNFELNGSLAFD